MFSESALQKFCTEVFCKIGFTHDNAAICSAVLVSADLRGIHSHGVNSLQRYISGVEEGIIIPKHNATIIKESPVSLLVDGNAAMGMITGNVTMQRIIEKAKHSGIAVGTVRNSNHFGYGAYYAVQALAHNLLGLVLTNTASIVVPTYGTEAKIGSNAISFAAPSHSQADFVLDMSTATVPRGLVKEFADNNKAMPDGWAIDEAGNYIHDASRLLDLLTPPSLSSQQATNSIVDSAISYATGKEQTSNTEHNARRGGLAPLGGKDIEFGGHKGYGLSLMVDVLTGILSGFKASYQICDTEKAAGPSAQTFIAIDIALFRDIDGFKTDMDTMLSNLQNSRAIDGHSVRVHGQQSSELEAKQKAQGIQLLASTYKSLEHIAATYGVALPQGKLHEGRI